MPFPFKVPQDQVKDSVQLFHIPRKRYISLRFLAYYFLGKSTIKLLMLISLQKIKRKNKPNHHSTCI